MALETTQRSRRALLAGALGGFAALAAQAIGRPLPAKAVNQSTTFTNNESGEVVVFAKSATQPGYPSSGAGTALVGESQSGLGAYIVSRTGIGTDTWSESNIGLQARSFGPGQTSVYALKETTGTAVWGDIDHPPSGWGAVFGRTNGSGPGVIGENNSTGRGTWGRAFGPGDGIYGESTLGRGGRFKGKKAQIRLDPSTAATHPASGAKGDLFVDASGRLWFCRGATTWVRLA